MSNNNEKLVKDIRRRTRKKYSSEEKIRIVLEGMRGEESIAELCRREGLNQMCITDGVRNPGSWQTAPGWRYQTGSQFI